MASRLAATPLIFGAGLAAAFNALLMARCPHLVMRDGPVEGGSADDPLPPPNGVAH